MKHIHPGGRLNYLALASHFDRRLNESETLFGEDNSI